jgi:concanavalin A-like lectin/glucanase superfamily protein/beta-propeller repeat-containing protein/slime mold repeat-containing protein
VRLAIVGAVVVSLLALGSVSGLEISGENRSLPASLATPEVQKCSSISADLTKYHGELPLGFEPNRGQSHPDVRFLSRGQGYSFYLTANEAVLTLSKPSKPVHSSLSKSPALRQSRPPRPSRQAVIRIRPLAANPAPEITGTELLPGKSNYFIGSDRQKWIRDIPQYAGVRYKGVYPGVDMLFHGLRHRLEYDFLLSPGADPGVIRLAFEGVKKVSFDHEGNLMLRVPGSEILQHVPDVYQEVNGVRTKIAGKYVLLGRRTVAFHIGKYDSQTPLTIDPVLSYSTYFGSAGGSNPASSVAHDGCGNAYVVGGTNAANFPTTSNAYQQVSGGAGDAFVAKLNANGTVLLYSTYLGGNGGDGATSVAVDSSGAAYLTGGTDSTNFPIVNGYQATIGGLQDPFVAKLDPAGSVLLYSTYLGGTGYDFGASIAIGSSGVVYAAGETDSLDFPTTAGVLQSGYAGSNDIFLTKLDTATSGTSSLVYSTYFGGADVEYNAVVAADASGNAYLGMSTESSGLPAVGAFQAVPNSRFGLQSAYLAKIDPGASNVLYSTYLGGTIAEDLISIALDQTGKTYLTGVTSSTDFPVSSNAYQAAQAGLGDAFVAKLDTSQTGAASRLYATYLGGTEFEVGNDIAVDAAGNAFVTGYTSSTAFPTVNPLQASIGGGDVDAFVAEVNPSGSSLVFSTYLGGNGADSAYSITVDGAGNALVTGDTTSTDFPTTAGVLQPGLAGIDDAFVARICTSGTCPLRSSCPLPITVNLPVPFVASSSKGEYWISLPVTSSVRKAEDLCALIPHAITIRQLFPDVFGLWRTVNCFVTPPTCTPTNPEPGSCGSSCFCLDPGEAIQVRANQPTTFQIQGQDARVLITLPPGGERYLVSVPFCTDMRTWDDLAIAVGLPRTGPDRGIVTGRDGDTGIITNVFAGSPEAQSHNLVPGRAYRIEYTNSLGTTFMNPVGSCGCCAAPPSGLLDWWSLDETSGATANDLAAFNNAGSELGGPTHIAGFIKSALGFDGVDDYVSVPDHPELDLGMGDFTLDAWVRTTGDGILLDKRDALPRGYSFYLNNGRLGFQMADASGGGCFCSPDASSPCTNFNAPAGSPNVADGNWHHVAVTVRRSSTDGGHLYVDGDVVLTFNPTVRSGNLDNAADLWMGSSQPTTCFPIQIYWAGDLDEVELFNRELSFPEIQALFGAGSCGKCKCNPGQCDDLNACTIDTCDPATGACLHAAVNCDDGDACTIDTCNPSSGCQHGPVNCNDGNPCTNDSCSSASGCGHVFNTAPCNDGDGCTQTDNCLNGACVGTNPVICPNPEDSARGARTYGVSSPGNRTQAVPTSDGGSLVVSGTPYGTKPYVPLIYKVGSTGEILWKKGYDIEGYMVGIRITSDGGFVAVANVRDPANNGDGIWVLRRDGSGTEWQKVFPGLIFSEAILGAEGVDETLDGDFIVHASHVPSVYEIHPVLIKLSSSGQLLWAKTYGQQAGFGHSIKQFLNGDLVLAESRLNNTDPFAPHDDVWISRVDHDGNVLWSKTYGGPAHDWDSDVGSIQETPDGGLVVVGGRTHRGGSDPFYTWIVKLAPNGIIEWQKSYGTPGDEYLALTAQPEAGGYMVAGYAYSASTGNNDFWSLRLFPSGSIDWQRTYEQGSSIACSIAKTPTGYLMAGDSYYSGEYRGLVLKLDPSGNVGSSCVIVNDASAVANTTDASSTDIPITPTAMSLVPITTQYSIVDPGLETAQLCPESDPCRDPGTCNPATGLCSEPPPKPDGTTCSDGSACTTPDTCQAGICTGGGALNCNDQNACTDDFCSSGNGCRNLPHDADYDAHSDPLCGGDDCNDTNPNVWLSPVTVTGLTVTGSNPSSLSWDSQGSLVGYETSYDVASIDVPTGGSGSINFATATCLQRGGTVPHSDTQGAPAMGYVRVYIVRARNSCGVGTYGSPQVDTALVSCN